MKYLIRSIKYFFYLLIILALVICALIAFKIIEADFSTIFVNGYDSYWQIALLMAVFAIIYPKFGFSERKVYVPGEFSELAQGIRKVMEEHGYVEETATADGATYIKRSAVTRTFKMWEDRITLKSDLGGFRMEGLAKDLPRLISAIEAEFSVGE